jgi:DNA repair protein RecO (recombination protein O)
MTLRITEGIILQTLKYQDYDQIISVFTPDNGILKLFFKGAYQAKNGKGSFTSPFSRIEFVYLQGKNELHKCREISLLNSHFNLRKSLSHLEPALDILKAVIASQIENEPSQIMYKLLLKYLERIPSFSDPWVLATSFRLKILRHEGLFGLSLNCSVCQSHLTSQYVAYGASYCSQHAPPSISLFFSEEEVLLIQLLAFTRTFVDLNSIQLSSEFSQKVRDFFIEALKI